jgi:hypothetical protein
MINPEDRHRVGRARILRRQGRTYDEIRAEIGDVSEDRLQVWLRGIPRPPETNRSGAGRPELRRKARQLRAEGMTINEIASITGASKGSISPWVRDIQLSSKASARHSERVRATRGRAGPALRRRAEERHRQVRDRARRVIGDLSARELFIAGTALYWAEGSKTKPWRQKARVVFINSDVSVLKIFLAWLQLIGVEESRLRFGLNIHESADVAATELWWQEQLGLRAEQFQRPTLKRHNPKPSRHNRSDTYHGCLRVTVTRSTELYYSIEGWWQGAFEAIQGCSERSL